MARLKRTVGDSTYWLPLRFSTSRREVGLQATATALRPSAGIVEENDNQVSVGNSTAPVVQDQDLQCPPRTQPPAVQVNIEQICSPALGEKLPQETPISANVSSPFPGAEGLQATAPAIRPSTRPAKEKHGYGPQRQTTIPEFCPQVKRQFRPKTKENRSPASASTSTATVVKVKGVDAGTGSVMPSSGDGQGASVSEKPKGKRKAYIMSNKPRVARGFKLTLEQLESDAHMLLEDKAKNLGVSKSFFKDRRREAGLERWPGRKVRAQNKRAQAQAHA